MHCLPLFRKSASHAAARVGAFVLAAALAASTASAAQQREGVDVGETSSLARLVPAAQVENSATQQYHELLQQAANKRALAGPGHPQLQRLKAISERLIPQSYAWNDRARQWHWEVNLIGSQQVNAFCMPGGKIAVFTGILEKLQLTDDELAMVVGHEMAHAVREHARERMGKSAVTQGGLRIGGAVIAGLLGFDPHLTDAAARGAASLLTLKFSRSDESEADLVGMEMAARAGYDPRAAVTLWKKMSQAAKGAPPQWLSTHPSGAARIAELEKNLPRVMPLYQKAAAKGRG